jgi:L-lactate dehydrogenase complex protein LldG
MSATNNSGRAAILERIRAGLRTPAPEIQPVLTPDGAVFETVGEPLERFQREAKANLMECLLANDAQGSARHLKQVLESLPPGEVFVQDHPLLRSMIDSAQSGRAVRWSSEGAPKEGSQATISLVDALIAQTGSIFVTAACGGRGASIVAPCHIAVAGVSQLVPDLRTALGNATKRGVLAENSFACVISGSSRTADIEKILVQGAHGPRRLVVILQNEGIV